MVDSKSIVAETIDLAEMVRVKGAVKVVTTVCGTFGLVFAIAQTWNIQLLGSPLLDTSYLYLILAAFLSLSFFFFPGRAADAHKVPWYDWILFLATFAAAAYLAFNGTRIAAEGWGIAASPLPTAIGGFLTLMTLEAVRRTGGTVLFVICLIFATLPLYSDYLSGFLWGPGMTLPELFRAHSMGNESIIGLPTRMVANLLIGYLVFGAALVVTGGGEFFLTFAMALLGKTRGGPAKVSILASGFFGSLSGSVISNVVTTGQVTIPTMKRTGYSPTYAGAVEACASTGGSLTPPIMGAVAFLMAEFLGVPYSTVVIAAIIPSLLFYFSLFVQTDMYAARNNLRGLTEAEIPVLRGTLLNGWPFFLALVVLVYCLVVWRIEEYAGYYATLVLIVSIMIRDRSRFQLRTLPDVLAFSTQSVSHIVGMIAGIGMILGSLSYTGIGGAFSGELLRFAGDSVALMLVLGALTSFVLGMGMTASACYIFLAIVLAPALSAQGLNPVATHLFILYWGMMSNITPPVALAAVAAAAISGADPIKTGLMSMRLAVVVFILPFLFVLNPALILQGTPLESLHLIFTACIAVVLLSSTFEGWLYKYGRITWERIPILIGALCFMAPSFVTDAIGFAIILVLLTYCKLISRRAKTA